MRIKTSSAGEWTMKVHSKTPGAWDREGSAKYKYVSDITQNTPLIARRHDRLGVRAKRPGMRRLMPSER